MEPQTEQKPSFRNEDFAKDMAILQAEIDAAKGNAAPVTPEVKVEPEVKPTEQMPAQAAQPETPAAEPPAVTPEPAKTEAKEEVKPEVKVPDKFKNPDGTPNVEKVIKSTEDAEKAIRTYLAKEKELKQTINRVNNPTPSLPTPAANPAPAAPVATGSLDEMVMNDLAAQGIAPEVAKAMAPVMARLFVASQSSAIEEAQKSFSPIKESFEESARRRQIEDIGKVDPWVYTEDGVNTLNAVLTENQWMLHAPDPYKAAYRFHKGTVGVTRAGSQVLTPTPTAKATAPVPSATAANQTPPPATLRLDSKDAVDAHLKTLTPKQQEEFFIRQGFPAFDKRA